MTGYLESAGASFAHIDPAGFRILASLDHIARLLQLPLRITCGTEDHPPTDPHTLGRAYDVGIRGLEPDQVLKILDALTALLPRAEFTVLLETPTPFTDPRLANVQYLNPHATACHLHVQLRKGLDQWPLPPVTGPTPVAV